MSDCGNNFAKPGIEMTSIQGLCFMSEDGNLLGETFVPGEDNEQHQFECRLAAKMLLGDIRGLEGMVVPVVLSLADEAMGQNV